MDFEMAAVKVMCAQLKNARESSSSTLALGSVLFQRAWLQGILVSGSKEEGHFLLDDGTGVIKLSIINAPVKLDPVLGMYVLVVGAVDVSKDSELPLILVHKMVDLSSFPDREAMWHLEVIEAYKLFYKW